MGRRNKINQLLKTVSKTKIRPSINVGALLDIPTGIIIEGAKGEKIMNGGLSSIEGIVGLGNNFKSTIMYYLMIKAMDRMEASIPEETSGHTYDTEDNLKLNPERINQLAEPIVEYLPKDLIGTGAWSIISKSDMAAEEWVQKYLYPFIKDKEESNKEVEYTAFKDPMTGDVLKLPYPDFIVIDSLTEFEPSITTDMLEKSDLDKTNTMFMQQGLFKVKVMKELPRLANKHNIYFGVTAHVGRKIDMTNNPYAKPTKDLQYLKQDEKIKGAGDKLNFLTTHMWVAHGTTALINANTKLPEYPMYEDDVETDLNVVKLKQLRSKTGPSGYVLELVVSQREGVIPELTEFHYLKTNKFGIGGNPRSYWIELMPDIKLSRTTVRRKLKEDKKLRRAVNILAELKQLMVFFPQYKDLYCTPTELYEDIKKLGYDWNILLQTRGWWTIDNYSKKITPFLSTLDILRMRKGLYTPYWMDEKTKLPKKEYIEHFEGVDNGSKTGKK